MPNIVLGLSRQSRTSTFQIFFYHLLHFKKWWKCCFILKALLSSRYLNFCLDILVKQKTFSSSRRNGWLERLIFKFINVTTWLTNDCNTHLPNISRSKSQLDNEIWSGNRITIYFFANHAENEPGKLGLQLGFNIFRYPSTWHTIKTTCSPFIQRYTQFWFFRKGSEDSFSTKFCVWFFRKNVSHVILTDQISLSDCLYVLTYWAICVLELLFS